MPLFEYFARNIATILIRLEEHIRITGISVAMSVIIGVPLGTLISYLKPMSKPTLAVTNVVQAIPSLALLGFLVPILGIGAKPAIFMVIVYSLLPIVKNTFTGLSTINTEMIEAAKGIGMTRLQILLKVKMPLALPMIMAGIRISAVTSVGLVTIAAFIGAGGLGLTIYTGISMVNPTMVLAGAIPACLLALLVDFVASLIERIVTPKCFRGGKRA
ncbi:MAG: ABC transporter permease [Treponema sp.]|nr:ABC transporter permease [Treponema sp.]